jgi:hypothetical protein
MIHQSLMIPFSPGAGGGVGYPRAGKVQLPRGTVMLDRVSATPAGIMLHMLVPGEAQSGSNLVLPAGAVMPGVETASFAFAIVQDGEAVPITEYLTQPNIYLGSVAVPPGLGLHVYMREGE